MPPPSVLIVDPSEDNREVLCTALSRRGIQTWQAAAADEGLQLARQHRPDVIVFDVEADRLEAVGASQRFAAQAGDQDCRLIVLGRLRRGPAPGGGRVIGKPYHFAPLVHTIEQLAKAA
jgi:CheY-like chemotaxis protein